MSMPSDQAPKLPTGIPGFDRISNGGLPLNRCTLVSGTSGCGKTTLALQFLMTGVHDHGEPGVFVTFEETPDNLIRNVRTFGWDLEGLVKGGKIVFVDATPERGGPAVQIGGFDLSALMARIEHAVREAGAKRVILGSVGALFPQFADPDAVRTELHQIVSGLHRLGVTTMITLERLDEDGGIGRFGVEPHFVDNVLILRTRVEGGERRRTIEILKSGDGAHQKGEYPFIVDPADGVTVTVDAEKAQGA